MSGPATIDQRVLVNACLDHGVPFFWWSPGTLPIARSGIRATLESAKGQAFDVIGLEGFEADPTIHPRLDLIFDNSRTSVSPLSVVEKWPENTWVDVTLHRR